MDRLGGIAGNGESDARAAVAGAVAGGRLALGQAEQLLGFVELVDAGTAPTSWTRATWFRRLAQLRELGVELSVRRADLLTD